MAHFDWRQYVTAVAPIAECNMLFNCEFNLKVVYSSINGSHIDTERITDDEESASENE